MRDRERDPDAHQFFEARNVGDQVSVQVVAVEGAPELSVRGAGKKVVQRVEFLNGFGERRVASGGEGG